MKDLHSRKVSVGAYAKHLIGRIPEGQVHFSAIELFYWAACAGTAFIAAYLQELNYSASLVGIVMALINCIGIVASPIMGSLSDTMGSQRRVFLLCVIVSSVLFCLVPLLRGTSVVAMTSLILLLLASMFFKNPTSSLLDSWVVRTVHRRRTFQYGSVRLMGSIGYATMCIFFGRIAAKTGTQAWTFVFYAVLNIPLIVLCLVNMAEERRDEAQRKAEKAEAAKNAPAKKSKKAKTAGGQNPLILALKSYYFRMFLISHALLGLTLYCMTTFLPYKLVEIAGNSDSLGLVIALKSYMEIPTFLFGAAIMRRVNVKKLFPICAVVFFAEQTICLFSGQVWLVAISMMMHGFTYGMYLTCMVNYVSRVTPQEANASAMTISGSLQLAAGVIGSLIGGVLVDKFGANGYYAMAMILQLIAMVVFFIAYPLGRKLGHEEPDLSNMV
ncbi:MAG: MFS transporter [Clostridia bacterium]|nr:MFS transporter [Clostridia bacterium]